MSKKNWYKKSNDQSTFGFAEDDSTLMQSPDLYHADKSKDTLEALMDETSGFLGVESNLIKFKYNWELFTFPSGDRVIVVKIGGDKYVIDDFITPSPLEAREWISRLSESDLVGYYPDSETSFNKMFWDSPTTLYHGTYEDNVEGILRDGLNPMDKSRGIANRGTGNAVFMSDNPDDSAQSYPVILQIDTHAMKVDGVTPNMDQEGPIFEADLRSAAASRIGINDYQDDVEAGLYPSTVVCRQPIPPKYIKRI
jgi:hypothetical protein